MRLFQVKPMKCKVLLALDQPDCLLLLPLEAEPEGRLEDKVEPANCSGGWQVACYIELSDEADPFTRLTRQQLRQQGHLLLSFDELERIG